MYVIEKERKGKERKKKKEEKKKFYIMHPAARDYDFQAFFFVIFGAGKSVYAKVFYLLATRNSELSRICFVSPLSLIYSPTKL